MFLKDFSDNEKNCFSELMVILSSIDGDFSMDEIMAVDMYLNEMERKTLPTSIRPVDDIAAELLKSTETVRHAVIFELSMMARADEKVEQTESHMLMDLSAKLDIDRERTAQIFEAAQKMGEARILVSKAIN